MTQPENGVSLFNPETSEHFLRRRHVLSLVLSNQAQFLDGRAPDQHSLMQA